MRASPRSSQIGAPEVLRSRYPETRPYCLILRFTRDDLCAALREYWNVTFGEQISPPPGWGA
jgi:hypothetical protein